MRTAATSRISFREGTAADAAMLASLAESTFVDTFGAQNTADDMALYLADAFGEEIQRQELTDPRTTVLFAERDGDTVGYAMLRAGHAPECVTDRDAIEIARLYAIPRAIGTGVGAALMQRCLDVAAARGRHTVWLGVWEHNPRAIAFYRKWGFVDVGAKAFVLGRDHQADRVMMRAVGETELRGDACDIR